MKSIIKYFASLLLTMGLPSLLFSQQKKIVNLTQFVDPFIGTKGHGHVFLGANVPSGAVQLGPSNIIQSWDKFGGWDWCSGYNYVSSEILGFTHTHLSGTGIGDLNDLLILPATGPLQLNKANFGDMNSGYGSSFSHKNETSRPGYYKVYLDKYKVSAELTATERVGFHQYHFENAENAHVLIDLAFGMGWDSPTETFLKKLNDSTFCGYRFSTGWANDQRLYFSISLSQPVTRFRLYDSVREVKGDELKSKQVRAALYFDARAHPILKIKVGLSPVSCANAAGNIRAEIPAWDFSEVAALATTKWNEVLGKINIVSSPRVKRVFYTALYHANFFPSLFNDVNGDYRGADKQVHNTRKFNNYTVFSLWDTYRGLHPLQIITRPELVNDYINTMLSIYQQQGKLPVWHLQGNETNTMIGYPAVPVIVDAYLKGFRGYDINLAYEAVKQSALQQTDGLNFVEKLGYIPADSIPESVAKAQEYAISDYCIALMAKSMGKKDDYKHFMDRAGLYTLYFDSSSGHMRGRMSNGSWRTPFNPFSAEHRANDYCEGNSWQYSWLVPQDVPGLIKLFGGDVPFIKKLDSLFTISSVLPGDASPDISGLIGQYAQGNEPDHHIAYLYNYAGEPWKTASITREVADSFYNDSPEGLTGNDDAGEMSAWYIFTALGFYPVNPVSGEYVFGSPLIDRATINLPAGKKFVIEVKNNSTKNKYIEHMLLNGKIYSKSFITHQAITAGGLLEIFMGDKPSFKWGIRSADRPGRPSL